MVELAKFVLNATDDIGNFLPQVMYTDEANLHTNGHVKQAQLSHVGRGTET
jgi:hypothetical protein